MASAVSGVPSIWRKLSGSSERRGHSCYRLVAFSRHFLSCFNVCTTSTKDPFLSSLLYFDSTFLFFFFHFHNKMSNLDPETSLSFIRFASKKLFSLSSHSPYLCLYYWARNVQFLQLVLLHNILCCFSKSKDNKNKHRQDACACTGLTESSLMHLAFKHQEPIFASRCKMRNEI